MRIIDKVEISYFRSIYSETLKDLQHLNILVGGNDSGKSNVLKALNLFFNNKTDLDTDFSFTEDLTRGRASEASEAKGRATIWIKVTFNNFLNWKSLPNKFVIKKSWNRYEMQPEVSYPGNPKMNKIMAVKFMNRLRFHYIPAVRGRRIYSHFLAELHDSLISDEKAGVANASENLAAEINAAVIEMSEDIENRLGFSSTIRPPQHLRDLFRSLDFSTQFSEFQVPLQNRGDGIQSRYIPFILNFLSEHSRQYHMWAYEEPENSLEMGQSFKMAQHFADSLSQNNQIFVTSHSPAFYDLNGDVVAKWLVQMLPRENLPHEASLISSVSNKEDFDAELGLASLISERAREVYDQLESSRAETEELRDALTDVGRPVIIVEGKTDQLHLRLAYHKLYERQIPFDIVAGQNANSVADFLMSLRKVPINDAITVVGLVDADPAGHNAIQKSIKFQSNTNHDGFFRLHREREIYFGFLPKPPHVATVDQALDTEIPYCIEKMYPPEVLERAIEDGVMEMLDVTQSVAHGYGLQGELNLSTTNDASLLPNLRPYVRKENDRLKNNFVKWLEDKDSIFFESFRKLFEILEQLVVNNP